MSSFEDIYQKMLRTSRAETSLEQLMYIMTYHTNEVLNLIGPFLQVMNDTDLFYEWYTMLETGNVIPQDQLHLVRRLLHQSLTSIKLRRILDLVMGKIQY